MNTNNPIVYTDPCFREMYVLVRCHYRHQRNGSWVFIKTYFRAKWGTRR